MENKSIKKIKLGKYQHYKGDIVEVIGYGLHSETLDKYVIYIHITGKRKNEVNYWIRPFDMFFENIVIGNKEVPRFKYINGK